MSTLKVYLQSFLASPMGQMAASFLRVAAATVVGLWIKVGTPLPPSSHQLSSWVEAGISAGVALVVANYFGPWESRYGRQKVRKLG